jgi:leucyl/phenylalanyl-tRNA---protein transferase
MHAPRITPEIVLRAYAEGLFPMAEHRDDPNLFWVSPDRRGFFPLEGFHVSKRLARTVRSDKFLVSADTAFREVMLACAAPAEGREDTWINDEILRLYADLFASGHAHSIEVRLEGKLTGGLYGVSLGGAFFGESMFSRVSDASKVALVHLVARLKLGGFRLLDAQFLTPHLARLGAVEIPREDYLTKLHQAVAAPAYWPASSGPPAYWPASSGKVGMASLAPALGDTGLTGAVAATGTCWPGALAMQLITQTS